MFLPRSKFMAEKRNAYFNDLDKVFIAKDMFYLAHCKHFIHRARNISEFNYLYSQMLFSLCPHRRHTIIQSVTFSLFTLLTNLSLNVFDHSVYQYTNCNDIVTPCTITDEKNHSYRKTFSLLNRSS